MTKSTTAASRLADALAIVLGTDGIPLRLRAWDGSEAGPEGAPVVVFRSRRALRRILWSPGQLGLSRAYVAGEIEAPGDIFAAFAALSSAGKFAEPGPFRPPTPGEVFALLKSCRPARRAGTEPGAAAGGSPREPVRPAPFQGARRRRHLAPLRRRERLLRARPGSVRWCTRARSGSPEETGLDAAQAAKLDLVCRKLGLRPGMRVLDVGCGWGSFALHAAQHYGADVVGVTLSVEQAALARKRAADAGLTDRVDIRVQDYRDVDDGPFDAISSIGMSEHVGREQIQHYAARLQGLLRPGGRLLNHAISWNAGATAPDPDSFIPRYVFPDGEMLSLSDMVAALESAGLEVLDVEALRRHYALTLRAWVRNLEEHWDEAVRYAGVGRARIWRLYMAASALGFEAGITGVNQILVQRPGGAEPPLRRSAWI